MIGSVHTYRKSVVNESDETSYAAKAAYNAVHDDWKKGKVLVGDIVVFDWEEGRRNIVMEKPGQNGDPSVWLIDESVA